MTAALRSLLPALPLTRAKRCHRSSNPDGPSTRPSRRRRCHRPNPNPIHRNAARAPSLCPRLCRPPKHQNLQKTTTAPTPEPSQAWSETMLDIGPSQAWAKPRSCPIQLRATTAQKKRKRAPNRCVSRPQGGLVRQQVSAALQAHDWTFP